jgi:hypothetical protein
VLVSPRIPIADESAVIDAVLAAIGSSRLAADVRHIWGGTGALRVRRADPRIVGRGKHEPLVKSRLREGTGAT